MIIGATGFVGLDLVFLLSKHPKINIKYLCARKSVGKSISKFDKRIKKKLPKISKLEKVQWNTIDLVFLSTPNGYAQRLIKDKIKYKKIKFIDLSSDFRLKKSEKFKKWYGLKHKAKNLIKESIYSVSEFVKDDIKKYRIIGNPGCYPTSIQLALIPLIKKKLININNIIIDSMSGYSGAGKNIKQKFKHKNIFNSIFAYNVTKHRHMAELDQEFHKINKKTKYTFNTHLIPTFRGILSSIHVETSKKSNISKIWNELKNFHEKNYFVNVLKLNSEIGTNNILNTNMCEISVCKTREKNKIVIFSALDNLVKGASGQAVQNMNLSYGFKENLGLK